MKYEFSFYTKNDFNEINDMIIESYSWSYPIFSISRMEFSDGLHPEFTQYERVWERTVGIFRENGKIAACVINEGNDDGEVFFIFDSESRESDEELLEEMIFYAKTTMSSVEENDRTKRHVSIFVPDRNKVLRRMVEDRGFSKDYSEKILIKPFTGEKFPVDLPEGYTIADGTTIPAFYTANAHMASFNYSIKVIPKAEAAFANLRKQKHYNPKLDIYILDRHKRPVAFANIWYDDRIPYCELEPLGVAWWERRKGLATAVLNEASNRVMEMYPKCTGIHGGDQEFYTKIGYEEKESVPTYKWETEIYPSWEERSKEQNYQKMVDR